MLKLRKTIKTLENIRGRHTELVTVYIPAGYSITDVSTQLFQEKSTASNIKSKSTRKNVLTALERIIQHLKLFKQTPANGLVVFCGNVSPTEGKDDIQLWSFEPPMQMKQKIYWCGQTFVLEALKDMIKEKEVYGLVVLDAKESYIGMLRGKAIQVVKKMDSTVPSKSVKGGMSQRRYDRIREDALNDFMKKIAEAAAIIFLQEKELKGIIVGGPGPIKEMFVNNEYLHYELQKKLLGVKDVSYTDEAGLRELVNRSGDLMQEAAVVKEREILKKFFTELQKAGNITYGYEETARAMDMGAVDTLLISEYFNWVHVEFKCSCGDVIAKDIPRTKLEGLIEQCKKCGNNIELVSEKDLAEVLVEKAKSLGATVEFISIDTTEGQQFKELGGIGAFLRYRLS